MLFLSSLTASLLLANLQHAVASSFTAITPKAFTAPSPNVASTNVLEMTRRKSSTRSSALQVIRSNFGSAQVTNVDNGQEFSVPVQFGSQIFDIIMDTGSSDTWLAASNFECLSLFTDTPTDQVDCNFGENLYYVDANFTEIPDENFNISYGDGEFLSGCMGTVPVTLGSITVEKQEVGLVNLAGWFGDGFTSGLVGLAYPSITSAYAGPDPTQDNLSTPIAYNPIFTNMYQAGQVAPLFSIALNRDSVTQGPGGYLTLGGTPPVNFSSNFASTPIQVMAALLPQISSFSFYTITPEAILIGNQTAVNTTVRPYHGPSMRPSKRAQAANVTNFQAIIDSGTTLIYLPTDLADSINAAFDPPAQFDTFEGAYVVQCNAIVPTLGIQIGGQVFYINALDLIRDDGSGEGTCITGVNDSSLSGLAILGDVFLKNVVAVFDIGASEMRFAARED